MNDPVVNEPPHEARPSVREELVALRNAAEQKHWREFLEALPQLTQQFRDVTAIIESEWNALCDDDQDVILSIDNDIKQLIEAPPQPNLGERVLSVVLGNSDDQRRQIRRLSASIGAFMNAVDRQVREEERIRKLLDTAAATDPDAIRRLVIGAAEAKAELVGAEFRSPEKFRTRFG